MCVYLLQPNFVFKNTLTDESCDNSPRLNQIKEWYKGNIMLIPYRIMLSHFSPRRWWKRETHCRCHTPTDAQRTTFTYRVPCH